jgi:hypothetical protein
MEFLAILVILVLGALGAAVWYQTKTKGRWGIGSLSGDTRCPRCGARLPTIRKPASTQEMLWGGWTCTQCGCKIDKYGREIAAG